MHKRSVAANSAAAHADDLFRSRLENPYWPFFTGEVVFQTRLPCNPSLLTRWRQRLGEAGMEELLVQSIAAARMMKAVDTRELSRVIVDSAVQEKAVAHPTDSRLLEVGRRKLRQTYEREAPRLSRKTGRHAYA